MTLQTILVSVVPLFALCVRLCACDLGSQSSPRASLCTVEVSTRPFPQCLVRAIAPCEHRNRESEVLLEILMKKSEN